MTTSTALSVVNSGLAYLWDYVRTTLLDGSILTIIIAVAVLFGAIAWLKSLAHRRY